MVKGYQGNGFSEKNTLMACVKYFALYGAAEAGRDYNIVDMSRIKMYEYYLPPYKAAVDAGVGSVMASFNEIDGVPATANKWLLTDLLRKQWGFKGFVVTDYTGINENDRSWPGRFANRFSTCSECRVRYGYGRRGVLFNIKEITASR